MDDNAIEQNFPNRDLIESVVRFHPIVGADGQTAVDIRSN